ncbi:p48 polypeptide of DNA primase, partial [Elasticomyces elasticus]
MSVGLTSSQPNGHTPQSDIELPDPPAQEKIALDNIFDDDDSDDAEFPTSTAPIPSSPPPQTSSAFQDSSNGANAPTPNSSASDDDPATTQPDNSAPPINHASLTKAVQQESYSDPSIMLQYYTRLFPF